MFNIEQHDLAGTPFWAEIYAAGENDENEWSWAIWTTDPGNDHALVEVERGSSASKADARSDIEMAAQTAMESWGFND
ncbi:MAG: hypothetical protein HYZ39_04800 [Mycolicibacterium cosmeticum]|nr:hypothetical protein [Mycolicibacterium cosmeticum]